MGLEKRWPLWLYLKLVGLFDDMTGHTISETWHKSNRKFMGLYHQTVPAAHDFQQSGVKKGLKARIGKNVTWLLQNSSQIHTKQTWNGCKEQGATWKISIYKM